MSKRLGNVNDFKLNNVKRAKVDQTLDDLWGDDLDIDDVDNCLMLATQMCQQNDIIGTQRNNQSVLPSYSFFQKTSNQLFTSTQTRHTNGTALTNGTTHATKQGTSLKRAQSFDNTIKDDNLEAKVKTLQKQCEAKAGEVSILRGKLQDIKTHHDTEQSKIQKEWSDKLSDTTKQLKEVQSELEFKNLEIMNLTQKLKEAAKITQSGSVRSPFFKQPNLDRSTIANTIENNHKENEEIYFDVKVLSEQNIKKYVFEVSLQDMFLKDVNKKAAHTKSHSNSDVLKLAQLNTYELDLVQNQTCIKSLLTLSEQLLQNLYRFLEELKACTNVEDTHTINLERISVQSVALSKNEMGFYAKETLTLLSEALPYSSYLKHSVVLNSKGLYLALLLSIVKLINDLKLSINFNHFLQSVTALLLVISELFTLDKIIHRIIIIDLTKELIYCTTSRSAFALFLKYLDNATLQQNFLSSLCTNARVNDVQLVSNDKILSYTKKSCVLLVLFVILEEYLSDNCLENALQFLAESVRCNPAWFFYKEDNCPCVSKIVKLYIDVLYRTLQIVKKSKDFPDKLKLWKPFLLAGVDNVYTLNFNLYFLVAKYLATYSHYTVIVKKLLNMKGMLNLRDSIDLENLNVNEEIGSTSKDAFHCTTLWNNSILN
ncbi:hypothetical protein FQR65_LT02890 [Abscondita terminalis]|nr:hypothetical protein FQR65_LT02890 [Abscondita terminalis]